jgi:hypothetical protein
MKNRKFHHLTVMLAFAALTCISPFVHSAAAEVQPIETSGASYGEWGARWWEWAFSFPAANNPILEPSGAVNCARGQTGNVWFLAGTFEGSATRSCTIPKGKSLFLPLINAASYDPFPEETTISLRQQIAEQFIDLVTDLNCRLDGKPCAKNLFEFRAQSPIFEAIVPPGGIAGNDVRIFIDPMVADGYWLLLSPLSPGHHVLKFGGESTGFGGFSTSVTYHLTVQR